MIYLCKFHIPYFLYFIIIYLCRFYTRFNPFNEISYSCFAITDSVIGFYLTQILPLSCCFRNENWSNWLFGISVIEFLFVKVLVLPYLWLVFHDVSNHRTGIIRQPLYLRYGKPFLRTFSVSKKSIYILILSFLIWYISLDYVILSS